MAVKSCKCKCNSTLLNIDIIMLVGLGIIAFGIFDIIYATTTTFKECTYDKIKGLLIADGVIFIIVGLCITIECVYTHIEFLHAIHEGIDYSIEGKWINCLDSNFYIPKSTASFILVFQITMFIWVAAADGSNDTNCRDEPEKLLMINAFVVGMLPLTIIVMLIGLAAGPFIICWVCVIIYNAVAYCCQNIGNICCFEIVTTPREAHITNGECNV